jgi:hypothetical protein
VRLRYFGFIYDDFAKSFALPVGFACRFDEDLLLAVFLFKRFTL